MKTNKIKETYYFYMYKLFYYLAKKKQIQATNYRDLFVTYENKYKWVKELNKL